MARGEAAALYRSSRAAAAAAIRQFLALALESPTARPGLDASVDRMPRRPAIAFANSAGGSPAPPRSGLKYSSFDFFSLDFVVCTFRIGVLPVVCWTKLLVEL